MAHSNVEPASSAEKSKLADVELVGSGIEESIDVSGSLASYVKVRLEAPSTFPATSRARNAHVVVGVDGEVGRREGIRPCAGRQVGVDPDLGRAREGTAVPVVAALVADGELDLSDSRSSVEVRPAEAGDGAARIPGGDVVEAGGGRERDRRGRRCGVELEGAARRRLGVADGVAGADADGVVAVGGEVGGVEVVGPVAGGEVGVVPDFGGAGEGGAVPVVARALADGDLDLGHAERRAVAVGAAEAGSRAAGVPLGRACSSRGRRGRRAWSRGLWCRRARCTKRWWRRCCRRCRWRARRRCGCRR